jgi:hypothetical protein
MSNENTEVSHERLFTDKKRLEEDLLTLDSMPDGDAKNACIVGAIRALVHENDETSSELTFITSTPSSEEDEGAGDADAGVFDVDCNSWDLDSPVNELANKFGVNVRTRGGIDEAYRAVTFLLDRTVLGVERDNLASAQAILAKLYAKFPTSLEFDRSSFLTLGVCFKDIGLTLPEMESLIDFIAHHKDGEAITKSKAKPVKPVKPVEPVEPIKPVKPVERSFISRWWKPAAAAAAVGLLAIGCAVVVSNKKHGE